MALKFVGLLSKPLVLVTGVALLAVVGLVGWKGYDYVEHDPAFCTSCHLMNDAYERWKAGEHHDVNCHGCHIQGLKDRATIVFSWLLQSHDEVPPHTILSPKPCIGCHRSQESHWVQIEGQIGHQVHVSRAQLECLQCHLPKLHSFKPVVQDCQRCHSHNTVKAEGMAEFHCVSCHEFTIREVDTLRPGQETCLHCHGNPEVEATQVEFSEDMVMNFECSKCHNPHESAVPTSFDCLGCHEDMLEDAAAHASAGDLSDCVACHVNHHWVMDDNGSEG